MTLQTTNETSNDPDGYSDGNSGLNLLFLSGFPMLLWVLDRSFAHVFAAGFALALFCLALRLIGLGMQAQDAYDADPSAKRPDSPRKLLGAILMGSTVAILGGTHFATLFAPVLLGCVAAGLSIMAFGLDPMTDKPRATHAPKTPRSDTAAEISAKLDSLVRRVDRLQDMDLSRQTACAAGFIQDCLLSARGTEQHPASAGHAPEQPNHETDLQKLCRPALYYATLMNDELTRLEQEWTAPTYPYARYRFVAKLDVLTDGFAQNVEKSARKQCRDQFDRKAGLLIERMRQEKAA